VLNLPKAPYFGYANRNLALREARGDLLAYAAHDDLLFPDHLALLARSLEEDSREWTYSRPWVRIIEGGGRQNMAYMTTPTSLHFSANWKASRHSDMPLVKRWLDVADVSRWWPPALRYEIPASVPEQQVIAGAMSARAGSWAEEVRSAVALVIDRVAWETIAQRADSRLTDPQKQGSLSRCRAIYS
jgi:hypothetical protein